MSGSFRNRRGSDCSAYWRNAMAQRYLTFSREIETNYVKIKSKTVESEPGKKIKTLITNSFMISFFFPRLLYGTSRWPDRLALSPGTICWKSTVS